jgi:hypothetical protein
MVKTELIGYSGENVKSLVSPEKGHKGRGEEMTSGATTNGDTMYGCLYSSVSTAKLAYSLTHS